MESAICKSCKESKPATLENFRKSCRNGKPMLTVCKPCYNVSRRENDRERGRLSHRKQACRDYKRKNKEKCRDLDKKWREKNKEYYQTYMKDWLRKRYHSHYKHDPKFRIQNSFQSQINHALKGSKAGRKWEDLVGYTVDDLKTHLESLWEPWMNWGNYGNPNGDHTDCWHIDHIKPVSLFDYDCPEDPSFRMCWGLSNLQPLRAKENLRKGNKWAPKAEKV